MTVGAGDWHTGKCVICKRVTRVESYRATRKEAEAVVDEQLKAIHPQFREGARSHRLAIALKPFEVCERCQNAFERAEREAAQS